MYKNELFNKNNYSKELKNIIDIFKLKWKYFLKKENNFVTILYTIDDNCKSPNKDFNLFPQWEKKLKIEDNDWEYQNIKFYKYLIIHSIGLDTLKYINTLKDDNQLNIDEFDFTLGYSIEKNKPYLIKNEGWDASGEAFHPVYVWASWSWKWVGMKNLIAQMGENPMVEFLIIDKSKDFLSLYNTQKVLWNWDYEEMSSSVSKTNMFFTFLIAYYSIKSKMLNDLGYIDYKSYYKDYLKQKEAWNIKMPVIPYTVVVYDEIQTQRATYKANGWNEKDFDWMVSNFLSVARSGWFKLIGWTQDPSIEKMWNWFKDVKQLLFKVKFQNISWTSIENTRILNDDVVFKSRMINFNDSWIKPAFSPNLDSIMKKACDSKPDYKPKKYDNLNLLFLSLLDYWVDSTILTSYKELFEKLWLKENQIKQIEKADAFFNYISLTFYINFLYRNDVLDKETDIYTIDKNFKSKIDTLLFHSIKNTDKSKFKLMQKELFWIKFDSDDQFYQKFWSMLKKWFIMEIAQ